MSWTPTLCMSVLFLCSVSEELVIPILPLSSHLPLSLSLFLSYRSSHTASIFFDINNQCRCNFAFPLCSSFLLIHALGSVTVVVGCRPPEQLLFDISSHCHVDVCTCMCVFSWEDTAAIFMCRHQHQIQHIKKKSLKGTKIKEQKKKMREVTAPKRLGLV